MTSWLAPPENTDDPIAPRIPQMVGREELLDAIRAALATRARSWALYFCGPGGIGKTRLLEEIVRAEGDPIVRFTEIIDLYHADYRSPESIRLAIADQLDPGNEYFQRHRQLLTRLREKRREEFTIRELDDLHEQLALSFQEEYKALAMQYRLVLRFDTLELLQHESEIDQEIYAIQDVHTVIKNWLRDQVSQLPNTGTLFAGRPCPAIEMELQGAFEQAGAQFQMHYLEPLSAAESAHYFVALRTQLPQLAAILTPDVESWLARHTGGRPIYLTLLTELLLHGAVLNDIIPVGAVDADEALIRTRLVEFLQTLPDPFGLLIHYLVCARRGLDADLLEHLAGGLWTQAEIREHLARLRALAFVKVRPGHEQLFLHDEVYNLFDEYFRHRPLHNRFIYEAIADYYRQRLDAPTASPADKHSKPRKITAQAAGAAQQREDWMLARLYYELQLDAHAGYYDCFVPWDDAAIKSHETGFDMRLRDEVLRFLNRYANPASPFYDTRVAGQVNWDAITRDSALRWINRYLARGDNEQAGQIGARLRVGTHPALAWDRVADPAYKAGLLTAWSQALLYSGAVDAALPLLEEALAFLDDDEQWPATQQWSRTRLRGQAHNLLGYLYRLRGRYGKALDEYKRALPFFDAAVISNDKAMTLTNLAYLLAHVGRPSLAHSPLDRAEEIRQKQGAPYPLALIHNTRGIIYTLGDQPLRGARACREALRLCEELEELRGIGLACNALGLALRKCGEQWKDDVYSWTEAQQFFADAERSLLRARRIFSGPVHEPVRLCEAYNELGSLYCDWGWLSREHSHLDREAADQLAQEQYRKSIDYQARALAVAERHKLEYHTLDSWEDLAQVYGDLSFLQIQTGLHAEGQASRAQAETYLAQIEAAIPVEYRLRPGEGFGPAARLGESYLRFLGKVHHWRATWGFIDLLRQTVPTADRATTLTAATRQFIVAVNYFIRFWPHSSHFDRTLIRFCYYLQGAGVSAAWVQAQVEAVADLYAVDLGELARVIDNMLGV